MYLLDPVGDGSSLIRPSISTDSADLLFSFCEDRFYTYDRRDEWGKLRRRNSHLSSTTKEETNLPEGSTGSSPLGLDSSRSHHW